MSRIVFLLEEPSMKALLEALLPRIFPSLPFLCVPHEGKHDLERSIPRKLKAWREPGVRFVVVRDNDGGDCRTLKRALADLCRQAGRSDTLIRIVCQELEAWYLGEPAALIRTYGSRPPLNDIIRRAKYRDPDALTRPAEQLARLVPSYQKISGARRLGMLLSEHGNCSTSFRVFLSGVRRLAATMRSSADAG